MTTRRRRKTTGNFYLKNENLLQYIHESKKSFCEYEDFKYSDFDWVLDDDETITPELVQTAKLKRATRINDIQGNKLFQSGMSNKEVDNWILENGVKPDDFSDNEVVFRRMTDAHIPNCLNKHGETVKEKTSFPPFIHVILDGNSERVVGRSHYKDGQFGIDYGRVNDRLGKSFLELVDRYGSKWNWRNYSWLEEMKGQALIRLSAVALQFDESKSQNPFAWYTMVVERTFIHVLQSEKKQLNIKRKLIENDPDIDFNITFGDQAQRDIDCWERDNQSESPKKKHLYRTSGKSLKQIEAERLKEAAALEKDEFIDVLSSDIDE
jgi:hypothetical protein